MKYTTKSLKICYCIYLRLFVWRRRRRWSSQTADRQTDRLSSCIVEAVVYGMPTRISVSKVVAGDCVIGNSISVVDWSKAMASPSICLRLFCCSSLATARRKYLALWFCLDPLSPLWEYSGDNSYDIDRDVYYLKVFWKIINRKWFQMFSIQTLLMALQYIGEINFGFLLL